MACGCAARMRRTLSLNGHILGEDSVWRKEGSEFEVPDERIEDEHFQVLIDALSDRLFGARATNFLRRLG